MRIKRVELDNEKISGPGSGQVEFYGTNPASTSTSYIINLVA